MSVEEREAFRRRRAERVVPAYGSKGCICKYGDPGFDGRDYEPDWHPEKRCPVNHRPTQQETKHNG